MSLLIKNPPVGEHV
ncbi:hypothetical protein D1U33_gp014 [Common midwife toad virus]|uniref:Uncharacterized protein n=1 Tax=common midwife toad virus-NL TaxID=2849710 RepID=A0A0A0VD70_9VIRU|nr:hypothetical protein D1U33_gp014 [Common midwife toad virus]AIW68505.1 hypothetical protein [common midwife toad virus-NL]